MVVGIVQKAREGERERGQGIDSLLKQICTKIYCLFSESKIHYILFFRLISSSPSFPTMRRKGKEKRKRKRKRNPAERILPISPSINAVYTENPILPPLPGGSSLYIQQHHTSISIHPLIIMIERDRLVVDFFNKVCKPLAHMNRDQESQEGKMASPTMV